MVEGAGAELMQQSGQDLAWWECGFSSYTYIVLEAENPGCAKHIKRTALRRLGHLVGSGQI